MKKLTLLFFAIVSLSIQAQDFKPYKIKSGKIEYEKLNYSIHVGFESKNGVESGFREMVPYVSEYVIYYWDEYGDKAFEETYRVSEFGGKPLAEKIKTAETLWLGEHRYYYNEIENTIDDSPYYLRIECRENFQYYQIMDSWIKTQYKNIKKTGTKIIAGKEADYYRLDSSEDFYLWKGLILKHEMFSTNSKGDKRYDIDRTKVAVKIDTATKILDTLFNPDWLKRENLYHSIDGFKISELLDSKPNLFLQADNIEGIKIRKNDILFFVTTDLHLGKMMVLNIDKENQLSLKFTLFDNTNYEFDSRDLFELKNNSLVDMDNIDTDNANSNQIDFKWNNTNTTNLFPVNNIGLYLFEKSREESFFKENKIGLINHIHNN